MVPTPVPLETSALFKDFSILFGSLSYRNGIENEKTDPLLTADFKVIAPPIIST